MLIYAKKKYANVTGGNGQYCMYFRRFIENLEEERIERRFKN